MKAETIEKYNNLLCIDTMGDLLTYILVYEKEEADSRILIVNSKIPFVRKILKYYKARVIYARCDTQKGMEAIMDMISYEGRLSINFDDLLKVCNFTDKWMECYQGSTDMLIAETQKSWKKRENESCVLFSLSGDMGLGFTHDIIDMVKMRNVRLDCRYEEGKEIEVCLLWEKD